MTKPQLITIAKSHAKAGDTGWITPGGTFMPAPDVGTETVKGLSLGRHETAALDILTRHYPVLFKKLNGLRIKRGHKTWPDTIPMIRLFMQGHGFVRVAEDILDMTDYE